MKFEDKFIPEPNSGCWLWLHAVDKDGYGKHNGERAHRYSYRLYKNDPGLLHVLHICDNPYCVNPDHLFLGTHSDNMKDAANKNRLCSPTKKFSNAQIKQIREFSGHYKDAVSLFNISSSHYYRLRNMVP